LYVFFCTQVIPTGKDADGQTLYGAIDGMHRTAAMQKLAEDPEYKGKGELLAMVFKPETPKNVLNFVAVGN
jgi:hypothetical protein